MSATGTSKMSATSRWVKEAKERYDSDHDAENREYTQFLEKHENNEKTGGKREEKRTDTRRLNREWNENSLSEKCILVIGENGVGDEVLTATCIPQLMQCCKRVVWRCNPKLQRLFSRSFSCVEFITEGNVEPVVDGVVYSWELISRFRKHLNDFGWTVDGNFTPYLQVSRALRDTLRQRFADGTKKLVGLAWRSERDGETVSDKTCDMRDVPHWGGFFASLKDKVRFISLQYGDTQSDIDFVRWKYGVEIYQDRQVDIFEDIDAAAAEVATMDYVVSISTTTAHLAGALGVPGGVLLKKQPFVHWGAGKNICPWYPTLRPVQQKEAGDWQHVLETVTRELCQAIPNR